MTAHARHRSHDLRSDAYPGRAPAGAGRVARRCRDAPARPRGCAWVRETARSLHAAGRHHGAPADPQRRRRARARALPPPRRRARQRPSPARLPARAPPGTPPELTIRIDRPRAAGRAPPARACRCGRSTRCARLDDDPPTGAAVPALSTDASVRGCCRARPTPPRRRHRRAAARACGGGGTRALAAGRGLRRRRPSARLGPRRRARRGAGRRRPLGHRPAVRPGTRRAARARAAGPPPPGPPSDRRRRADPLRRPRSRAAAAASQHHRATFDRRRHHRGRPSPAGYATASVRRRSRTARPRPRHRPRRHPVRPVTRPRRSTMPEYLTPGVYVEETSFRSRSIEGVPTSTFGMAGATGYGPVPLHRVDDADQMLPQPGAGHQLHRVRARLRRPRRSAASRASSRLAARAFFANGGRRLYVAAGVRADRGADRPAIDVPATSRGSTSRSRATRPSLTVAGPLARRGGARIRVVVALPAQQERPGRRASCSGVLPGAAVETRRARPTGRPPAHPPTTRRRPTSRSSRRVNGVLGYRDGDGGVDPVGGRPGRLPPHPRRRRCSVGETASTSTPSSSSARSTAASVFEVLQAEDPADEFCLVWLDAAAASGGQPRRRPPGQLLDRAARAGTGGAFLTGGSDGDAARPRRPRGRASRPRRHQRPGDRPGRARRGRRHRHRRHARHRRLRRRGRRQDRGRRT